MLLTPENVGPFLERFCVGYDGVVVSVSISMRPGPYTAVIVIDSKDNAASSGWSRLTFTVTRVEQFRFEVFKTTFEVLSGGIQIVWKDHLVFVVFDAYPDDGPDLPDLRKNMAYVAGEECRVSWGSCDRDGREVRPEQKD